MCYLKPTVDPLRSVPLSCAEEWSHMQLDNGGRKGFAWWCFTGLELHVAAVCERWACNPHDAVPRVQWP